MNAKVVLVSQLHDDRIGNTTVADLQRRTIRNHVGHIPPNGFLHRTNFGKPDFKNGVVALGQRGDLRNMDMAIAVGKRDIRIDFQHHSTRFFDRGHRVVNSQ